MNLKEVHCLVLSTTISAILFSCCGNKTTNNASGNNETKTIPYIEVSSPAENEVIAEGKTITLKYALPAEAPNADSIVVSLNGKTIGDSAMSKEIAVSTKGFRMGIQRFVITAYKDGERSAEKFISVDIKSAEAPVKYKYKVIKSFPHDTRAYTQGLTFDNNILYEGTGLKGSSKLRTVDIASGDPINNVDLPDNIFGEGIAIFGDRIYQLSWQNQIGFIYDKNTLEKIGDFTYPGEGWGLTNDGQYLYMSDGSRNIRIINPSNFSEVDKIQVFDNNGAIENINELEFINGEIWANIYLTDTIIRIDPKTGKVVGTINMEGLLPQNERDENTDVLNGIAFNPKDGKLYVTGKNWPKMYEIKVSK